MKCLIKLMSVDFRVNGQGKNCFWLRFDQRASECKNKMASSISDNQLCVGKEIYQSVEENPTPVDAKIVGSFPQWLKGSLLRVGPGKLEWGDTTYNHWFDGDAILNRFEIEAGSVRFSSRFLRSSSYLESEKRGCIAMSQFGTVAPPDPCKNIFARFFSYFSIPEITDNCNVNIVKLKGDNYASTEAPRMWKINERTLESLQRDDIAKALASGPRSWLAHPHYDDDGSYYNCSTAYVNKLYQIIKIPARRSKEESATEGIEILASIPYKNAPGYYHSFSMTENYFLVIESSLFIANPLMLLMMKIMNWSFVEMFRFNPDIKSKLYLIDRKSNKLAGTFRVDAFMCFHQINAYETSTEVVFDMCGYTDASVMQALYLNTLREDKSQKIQPATLRRYRLPLEKADPTNPIEMDLDKNNDGHDFEVLYTGIELPRINYTKFNGKDYRFVYGMGGSKTLVGLTALIKVNVKTKESLIWEEENCHPSEPVFIACPDAQKEDEGVVLSAVLGVRGQKSFLLLLDGESFKEIARAYVPTRLIPLIHGEFLN